MTKSGSSKPTLLLTIAALGVVFGDIGTSPLYAIRECFHPDHGIPLTRENVFGLLSLIFWSLTIIVSFKYVSYVLRADNEGEGGILALLALLMRKKDLNGTRSNLFLVGLFGAALLYGDGVITPAISVLSAVEGLTVVTARMEHFVVPATVVILAGLFAVQHKGTGRVGAVFGPVMLLWFSALAVLGVRGILMNPNVLYGLNPGFAIVFFLNNGLHGFLVLGAVFLAITGAEALYADLGHFGRLPISRAWFWCVFPALVLNYFGQGALVLQDPTALQHPFFHLAPAWGLSAMILLATAATIIASQALISGAFSITRQAVQLQYLPRMAIRHTSDEHAGQIYVPLINRLLFIGTITLVLGFRSSSNLAAAYGVAVSLTMVLTSVLLYFVARSVWGWPRHIAIPVGLFFLVIDACFLAANSAKALQGGWVPMLIAIVILAVMTSWNRGRNLLTERLKARLQPFDTFVASLPSMVKFRTPGTAVYLARSIRTTPMVLFHHVKHQGSLHEQVLLVKVLTEKRPHVELCSRVEVIKITDSIHGVIIHFGFNDVPNVPAALACLPDHGIDVGGKLFYYLARETVLPTPLPGMALWREKLFAFLARNAQSAAAFFSLPPSAVVEVGLQVEI